MKRKEKKTKLKDVTFKLITFLLQLLLLHQTNIYIYFFASKILRKTIKKKCDTTFYENKGMNPKNNKEPKVIPQHMGFLYPFMYFLFILISFTSPN